MLWLLSTCPEDTFAPSHSGVAARGAGDAAEQAEHGKRWKYSSLMSRCHFVPVAVESLGVLEPEAYGFLLSLEKRLKAVTPEPKACKYLFQSISVVVQYQGMYSTIITIHFMNCYY